MHSLRLTLRLLVFILAGVAVVKSRAIEEYDDTVEDRIIEEQLETQARCTTDTCGDPQGLVANGCSEFCTQVVLFGGLPISPSFPSAFI